jgi:hypothetical protein
LEPHAASLILEASLRFGSLAGHAAGLKGVGRKAGQVVMTAIVMKTLFHLGNWRIKTLSSVIA